MRGAALAAALLLASCASTGVAELNARLVANPSATSTLDALCGMPVVARLSAEPPIEAPANVRSALGALRGETIRHRRVQLACGATVLSVADNWYRPSQLTPEMNRTLETSDTPFGRAVAGLNFSRRRLAIDTRPRGGCVLEHRAVLVSAAGQPFSYVIERYTPAALK